MTPAVVVPRDENAHRSEMYSSTVLQWSPSQRVTLQALEIVHFEAPSVSSSLAVQPLGEAANGDRFSGSLFCLGSKPTFVMLLLTRANAP